MILLLGFAAATGKKLFQGMQGANPCCQPCWTACRGSRGLLLGGVILAAQGPRLTTVLAPCKQMCRQRYMCGKNILWWSCLLYHFWCTPQHAPSTVSRIIVISLLHQVRDTEIKVAWAALWRLVVPQLPTGSHAGAKHCRNTTTEHQHWPQPAGASEHRHSALRATASALRWHSPRQKLGSDTTAHLGAEFLHHSSQCFGS